MKAGVKEMTLIEADEAEQPSAALQPAKEPAAMLPMIERLAALPDFDVAKLEKLLDMQERVLDRQAQMAFNVDFAAMQPEIPTITERAKTNMGKYAPREDIVDAVRPVLSRHGFSLSFRTEWPENRIKVVGILTHREGHSRESAFLTDADVSGSKNAVQARGSAVEYGRRYTTTDLLNIVTRGNDDDGKKAGASAEPEGFSDWWADMVAVADEGYAKLEAAYKASKPVFRNYIATHGRGEMEALQVKARKVRVTS